MPLSCAAYGCKNKSSKDSDISFHRFPTSKPDLYRKWVIAVRRDSSFTPTRCSFLCSCHFTTNDFKVRPGTTRRQLKDDAVPSLFDFSKHLHKTTKERKVLVKHVHEDKTGPSLESTKFKYTRLRKPSEATSSERNVNTDAPDDHNESIEIKEEPLDTSPAYTPFEECCVTGMPTKYKQEPDVFDDAEPTQPEYANVANSDQDFSCKPEPTQPEYVNVANSDQDFSCKSELPSERDPLFSDHEDHLHVHPPRLVYPVALVSLVRREDQ